MPGWMQGIQQKRSNSRMAPSILSLWMGDHLPELPLSRSIAGGAVQYENEVVFRVRRVSHVCSKEHLSADRFFQILR